MNFATATCQKIHMQTYFKFQVKKQKHNTFNVENIGKQKAGKKRTVLCTSFKATYNL